VGRIRTIVRILKSLAFDVHNILSFTLPATVFGGTAASAVLDFSLASDLISRD